MNNSQFPTARKSGLVVQEVPDEVLIYDLDTNKAHCLNKTAAAVWQSCDGTRSINDIVGVLESTTGTKVNDEIVWLAIDQLNENNLLETEIKADFGGQSRRDVLKKLGLATVVALPIVASLVAPTAVLASSSCSCDIGSGDPLQCQTLGCAGTCQGDGFCGSGIDGNSTDKGYKTTKS
jgi:hypothetical protein